MNKMNFKGKEIETILDILWAIKNDDKHYFYSYGRDCLKSLVKESDSLPLVSVSSIRAYVAGMNNDQRHNFFSLISEDYCKECGCDEIKYGKCHCWNDE